MKLHFISGLPRSGSTLFGAVLAQNPRFRASMSSPVAGIYTAMLSAVSNKNEFAFAITPEQRLRLIRAVFEAYYADLPPNSVAFDTNRMWCSKMPALRSLFPEARVICCVREVSWIMDSIERLIRRNLFDLSKIFDYDATGTVYTRCEALGRGDGLVGFAWNALREAFFGEQADRLILVRYESLVRAPKETIAQLYQLLDEPLFAHDFANIRFDAKEFDARLGTPGLHDVGPTIAAAPRQTILPPDLFRKYSGDNFWAEPGANIRSVTIL
jgi:sulfotransferase